VLVQLADGRQLVALEHHHLVAALAHGLVHCCAWGRVRWLGGRRGSGRVQSDGQPGVQL
jgi:hypothetical protein